ncbi:MAG TPA: aldehyde dehydrogenase family protein [Caldisericia bacterium]|jgi:aldehyde dehydrogenase (NAD+)|nr:aldehyde dehydrogenase family protein [Caldisericia bacterium]HXK51469.1 aldehyde dehydrogenase family protein [Caldisericia bacterium]
MKEILKELGIEDVNYGACLGLNNQWIKTHGEKITSYSPIDGQPLASIIQATTEDYSLVVEEAQKAFLQWRMIPAPQRGLIVRDIGNELRRFKQPLGTLISIEMGKILQEGLGEVQEMIDIADFAIGQSRMLYGSTMHSERPLHRMYDQYHPYGAIGIITSFNFPVAVWSWNALIAFACGDTCIWKPSSKTPLCAIAIQNIVNTVFTKHNLPGVSTLVIGSGANIGEAMIHDHRIPLISATGSTRMGKRIGEVVGNRLGKTILELGGNNAIIIAPDANLELALHASLFGAIGTAGQRCTSTRRIIIHKTVKNEFLQSLMNAYKQIKIGNPLLPSINMGPLIDEQAVKQMEHAIEQSKKEGSTILYGGERITIDKYLGGFYVTPCIADVPGNIPTVQNETFAPLLYIMTYDSFDDAINLHNDVPQGLSSSIFTNNLQTAELFLSHQGSDCGIANVNIGTSGAEIGGAFGGEKETGGGRESGSDAWKAYMRRQTNTINYGKELPLAQGIQFHIKDLQ